MAANLKVIEGGNEVSDCGSDKWARRIRKETKELTILADDCEMKLAQNLYDIWNTPVGGKAENKAIFQAWGYDTFAAYVENELGMHRKKAETLRSIWFHLTITFKDMPGELRNRLRALSWTKLRALIRVMPSYQSDAWWQQWIEAGETNTVESLESIVRQATDSMVEKVRESTGDSESDAQPRVIHMDGIESEPEDAVDFIERNGSNEDEDDGIPLAELPKPEKLTRETFSFFPDQYIQYEQAMERAAQVTKSSKKTHNLTVICMGYLAQHNFTQSTEDQRVVFMAALEDAMGVKLIAVDPEKEKILYGINALDAMKDWKL